MKRSKGKSVLHTKFVLKRKRDETGAVKKCNTRLVACENGGTEYDHDIFFPVSDFTVIKIILCPAIQRKWQVRQVNFQNAFPNGKLKRPLYAELPGHQSSNAHKKIGRCYCGGIYMDYEMPRVYRSTFSIILSEMLVWSDLGLRRAYFDVST